MTSIPPPPSAPGPPRVLGWSAFLACSWTWCIGMFLPALLIRDYGLAGFVVFAVPNVLGAAAMGWILRDDPAGFRIRHANAIRAFSSVTSIFQAFFLGWLSRHSPIGLELILAGGAMSIVTSLTRGNARLRLAGGVWVLSVLLGVFALSRDALGAPDVREGSTGLAWLAPVCVFGFLLCPYLDATFHRARAELPRAASRAAFSVGFGVMFLAMILLTMGYGADLSTLERALGGNDWASRAIQVHIALQLGFTMGAHARDIHWIRRSRRLANVTGCLSAGAILLGLLVHWPAPWAEPPAGRLGGGEIIYRAFMGCYGLVFPAYVWLVVIASPSGGRGPSRARMRVWAAAVGIAAPMFWKGFVERREFWLVPGLLVVLVSRIALPRRNDTSLEDPPRLDQA